MHQIQATIDALGAALKDAVTANPVFMSTAEKAEALLRLTSIEARVAELRLRVLAVSQDVADEIGARDVRTWLTGHELVDGPAGRAQLRLAQALDAHETVRAGLAKGRFTLDHARVILRAVEDLPDDLESEVVAQAESHLCQLATEHRPGDLRRLGHKILDVVAPEIAEEAEAKALQRIEAAAEAKATLSISRLGTGMTRVYALVPDTVGERLRTLVESFAQPRIAALDADNRVRPRGRIMAEAFGQLLETIDPDHLPAHGGDATTVVVTIPLDQLRRDLGVASLGDTPITAGEARRLACTAGILPAVLDGKSEPLDLGRTRRLFSPAQRKALKLRDQHCRAEGCTVPATWCHAHHHNPWSHGGPTDLTNAVLLCGHHHRRAHDPAYEHTKAPNGAWCFRRVSGRSPTRLAG